MAKFRINPASLQKVKANFAAVTERKKKQLGFALKNWALDVEEQIGKEIVADKAVDQGMLLAGTTDSGVSQQGSKLKITIFNPLEYSVIEELGRQPGGKPPPILPIIGWAARHGMTHVLGVSPDLSSLGKELILSAIIVRNIVNPVNSSRRSTAGSIGGILGSARQKKPLDPIVKDLVTVRLIARKIAEEGMKARHSFSRAWDRKLRTFAADIAAMVGNA